MPYDTNVDPADAKESLEIVNLKGKISISNGGFVQRILDLKKWMKSPWIEDKETLKTSMNILFCVKRVLRRIKLSSLMGLN